MNTLSLTVWLSATSSLPIRTTSGPSKGRRRTTRACVPGTSWISVKYSRTARSRSPASGETRLPAGRRRGAAGRRAACVIAAARFSTIIAAVFRVSSANRWGTENEESS